MNATQHPIRRVCLAVLLSMCGAGCDKLSGAVSDNPPTAASSATPVTSSSSIVAAGAGTSGTSDQGAVGLAAKPIAATPGPFVAKPGAEGPDDLYAVAGTLTHFGFMKSGGFAVCVNSAGARETKGTPFCRVNRGAGTTLERDKKPGDIDAFINREDLTVVFPETKSAERIAQLRPSTVGANVPGAPKRNTWKFGSTIALAVKSDAKASSISFGGFALGEDAVFPGAFTPTTLPDAKKSATRANLGGPFVSAAISLHSQATSAARRASTPSTCILHP